MNCNRKMVVPLDSCKSFVIASHYVCFMRGVGKVESREVEVVQMGNKRECRAIGHIISYKFVPLGSDRQTYKKTIKLRSFWPQLD